MIQLLQNLFRAEAEQSVESGLDDGAPLLRLSPHPRDAWTVKDSFSGTLITGETGSGKSSGSGAALARAFLRSGYGGLVLCCKAEEAATWRRYCEETGRLDSLLFFGAEYRERFNFLSYEALRGGRGGGQTENIVSLLVEVIETLERRDGGGRSDPYWDRSMRQMMRNAVDLLLISRGELRMTDLYNVITSAPQNLEQVRTEDWQAQSFCMRCVREGERREKTERQQHDFAVTARFWLSEFPALADKTRSIIASCFTSLADSLCRGLAHDLLCTKTTVVPEICHEGAILVLDLPIKGFDVVGLIIQTVWKLLFQRAVERRDLSRHGTPVCLWIDEAGWFLHGRSDPLFATTARSARCATVMLVQNLGNLHAAIGKAATETLTSNLTTKLLHANSDAGTNEWASNLIARTYQQRTTSGTSTRDHQSGGSATSRNTGAHESLEWQVLPIEFCSGLRKGGPENDWCVDAFAFEGGRLWQVSRKNFLRVSFKQQ